MALPTAIKVTTANNMNFVCSIFLDWLNFTQVQLTKTNCLSKLNFRLYMKQTHQFIFIEFHYHFIYFLIYLSHTTKFKMKPTLINDSQFCFNHLCPNDCVPILNGKYQVNSQFCYENKERIQLLYSFRALPSDSYKVV